MKRRGAIVVVVVVSIGALLLFARQWTAPTEVIVAKPQSVARKVAEPPVVRAEPPPAEATAPATSATASTPTGNFRGRVLDAATRQPVQKFAVEIAGIPHGYMRGNEPRVKQSFQATDGRFAWKDAPAGKWNVTVAAQHYQLFRVDDVSIAAGQATREIVMPMRRGEYCVNVGQDASRIVTIAGDAVVNFDIPLVQIGGRIVEEGGSVPIVGAGVHVLGVEPRTALVRNYKEADDFGQFRLTGVEPGEILLTVYKPGYEMFREKIAYSSPITNKAITLRKNAGVEMRVQAAENVGPVMPILVTEQLPGTEYGISVWIAVDRDGIAHLPSALAGSTLKLHRSGSQPIVIQEWDGQSLDLKFMSR